MNDEELQYQPAQLLGICQVCDYCRHFTFDTVDFTQMMGVGKLLWETLLLPCHGKKLEWYQVDRLGGRFSLPSPYSSYPRTYKQWSKVLKDVMHCGKRVFSQ